MNITVNIESTDRTSLIDWPSFTIQDNKDNQPNFLHFKIRTHAGQTYKPATGDDIEVLDGATKLFAGKIVQIKQTLEAKVVVYECTCKDKTLDLEKIYITERFTNQTVEYIIDYIATNYLSGITTTNVICPIEVETVAFISIPVSQAIQQLANSLNYSWYIDYDGDIHFFAKNQEPAPFNLTDAARNHIDASLEIIDDISQLRNRVTIRGAEQVATNTRTKTHTYLSTTAERTFATDYKFATMPVVKVNTVAKTVGVENIDDDADFEFMWDFNQKYVRATSTITLVNNDEIEIIGYPYIPIFVQVEDTASIIELGGDPAGVYEFEKVNKEIKSEEEAKQYAEAQIEAYSNQIREGGFDTYESGLKSGQTITITLTDRNIDDQFVIQRVMLKMLGPNDGIWTVDLATYKTIGIINYLQNQLLNEKITINEDEVLKKYYLDAQTVQVTEEITLTEKKQDYQDIEIEEDIERNPFGAIPPIFVLAPHIVTGHTDQLREFRLGGSYLSTPLSEHDVKPTTLVYWAMNGTAGTAAKKDNKQGNSAFDLVENSSPTADVGFNGVRAVNNRTLGAYGFNGSTQYLSGNMPVPAEGTLETWFKLTNITGAKSVLDVLSDYIYLAVSNDGLYAYKTGTTGQSVSVNGVLTAGSYFYVAMTWKNGDPVRLYLNGSLIGTSAGNLAGAHTSASRAFTIARLQSGSSNFLGGSIDEIILSNYQKTVTELANYYALRNQ